MFFEMISCMVHLAHSRQIIYLFKYIKEKYCIRIFGGVGGSGRVFLEIKTYSLYLTSN